ncbi:hypothetical protein HanIR_Chr02g0088821 [Helianthus annuus]|nr:hypothetical protein HanIR_Chr02g0088821 [Helianthus annuus]
MQHMFVTCVTLEGNICTATLHMLHIVITCVTTSNVHMSIHVKRVTLLKTSLVTPVTSTMLPTCTLNLINLSLLLLRLTGD